ncbi:MAG: hypothetical protein QME69_10795 [Candidatus Saccharicenans sp.]|nr:hypothetical protein [Candidatus Saccharicenans sp.]
MGGRKLAGSRNKNSSLKGSPGRRTDQVYGRKFSGPGKRALPHVSPKMNFRRKIPSDILYSGEKKLVYRFAGTLTDRPAAAGKEHKFNLSGLAVIKRVIGSNFNRK